MKTFSINSIGKIRNSEEGTVIQIDPPYIPALKALDGFSHINVVWWFSECDSEEARSVLETAQPYQHSPEVMGIFSTRSPIRPNPIALTASEVLHIDDQRGTVQIAYIDANDGSPILDIKPYTPSLDRVESPQVPDWCSHWPKSLEESAGFDWEKEFNF